MSVSCNIICTAWYPFIMRCCSKHVSDLLCQLRSLLRFQCKSDQPKASIMDINYTSGRRLNKELINRLATCEYISEHRNLFITGATGCGKTYMACAFGMEACKQYYNTRYVRMPDLLMDLDIARSEGNYRKAMAKYSNPILLEYSRMTAF